MKLIRAGATMVVLTAALFAPAPIGACSVSAPEPFADVLETRRNFNDNVVGFYEQRHIARFPDVLGFERSASVVTRYWGMPPKLRVASHGSAWPEVFFSTCGSDARHTGIVTANTTRERDLDRSRPGYGAIAVDNGEYGGSLSQNEVAQLDAAYGTSVLVSTGLDDYLMAYGFVLWRPLLFLTVTGSITVAIWARISKIEIRQERRFDGPTAVAALFGIVGIVIAAGETYSAVEFMWLLGALVGSLMVAALMRAPWAVFGVLYTLWALLPGQGVLSGISVFDDQRLHAGIAGLLMGTGALAWSRRHWTRWPATFTVIVSAPAFLVGLAEFRGYANVTKIAAFTTIGTAVLAFAVWWLVFRERRLSSGALAEPPNKPEVDDKSQQPVL